MRVVLFNYVSAHLYTQKSRLRKTHTFFIFPLPIHNLESELVKGDVGDLGIDEDWAEFGLEEASSPSSARGEPKSFRLPYCELGDLGVVGVLE